MLFAGYLMEEVWTDAGQRTLATGCPGSRTGLRGQTGRCTLAEFLIHIWTATPGDLTDNAGRPVRDAAGNVVTVNDPTPNLNTVNTFFNRASNRAAIDPGRTDVWKLARVIQSYRIDRVAGTSIAGGFVGNLGVNNVFGGGLDFFETIEQFGDRLVASKNEIDRLLADTSNPPILSDDQKRLLRKWKVNINLGATLVKLTRKMDDDGFKLKPAGQGGLRDYFQPTSLGTYLREKTVTLPVMVDENGQNFNFRLDPWAEPDRDATVRAAVAAGVDETTARDAYNDAEARFYRTTAGSAHKRVLDGIDRSGAVLGC